MSESFEDLGMILIDDIFNPPLYWSFET